jgi:hypothetical protein
MLPTGFRFIAFSVVILMLFGSLPLTAQENAAPLALVKGTVTQSSTCHNRFPEFAIDGDFNNDTFTCGGQPDPVWEVDMGEEVDIETIVIHNRNGNGSRLRDITVSILDFSGEGETVLYDSELLNPENTLGTYPDGPDQLTIDLLDETGNPVKGRVVRIQRTSDPDLSGSGGEGNNEEMDTLAMAEVEVLAEIPQQAPEFLNAPEDDMYVSGRGTYAVKLDIYARPADVTLTVVKPETGADITEEGVLTVTIADPEPEIIEVEVRAENDAGLTTAGWNLNKVSLPVEGLEYAGETFVFLVADNSMEGENTWLNYGTLRDFMKIGEPPLAEVEDVTAVRFDNPNIYRCESETPEGLVDANSTRSIEVWAYNDSIPGEETMVAWGHRGGPGGSNMGFNFGNHPNWGAVTHWGGGFADCPWREGGVAFAPDPNEWHHLVYTYDGTTTRVYIDGAMTNEEELGEGAIDTHDDPPIILGAQIPDHWELSGRITTSNH